LTVVVAATAECREWELLLREEERAKEEREEEERAKQEEEERSMELQELKADLARRHNFKKISSILSLYST
jgi:hypothetical protein